MTTFPNAADVRQADEMARGEAHTAEAQEETRVASGITTTRADLQRIAEEWRAAVNALPYHAAQDIATADGLAWRLVACADTAPICDTSPGAPRWHTHRSEQTSRPVLGRPTVRR